ncbi:MAG TPA: undecaprenyl-diphosphate phosphatase, partial [Emcibacteraceae bacterium]|nr:undecaprenyl-diphosphate phosphatase [Emcibacteraceae bacterium]
MTLLHIIVLAIVQGITEFLPISSSGHLILVPLLSDWPDQGVMMDVGVHVGTLGAVILYFRKEYQ